MVPGVTRELAERPSAEFTCASLVELLFDAFFQLLRQVSVIRQVTKDAIGFQVLEATAGRYSSLPMEALGSARCRRCILLACNELTTDRNDGATE